MISVLNSLLVKALKYRSINRSIKIIEKKLPKAYFIINNIFGGSSSLRKYVEKEKKVQGLSCLNL